ncbi:MAG: hypothetical protein EA341_01625 [Mongoliibacter sp.]|uniref:hypothetical protein n=1 Tax=Mongoliibacter sp. TaxID=2022438 RepID=UPI0012F39132|nr:hypothetical protein [Mongoliibacter sp.]TVP53075.1 MAG: hypothetical protein EA341_01625 [Mongoliibacter sp.]
MKTLIAMIVALGVFTNTFAEKRSDETTVKSPVSIRKVDDNKVQLLFGMVPNGSVLVKIYDESSKLVQKDRIYKNEAFAKYYDFSLLKGGKYNIEVLESNQIIEKFELDVRSNVAVPVIYSKVETVGDNKYKLLVNSLLPADLSILVYENGNLVHEESVNNVNGFQKLYSFVKFNPNANIEFVVQTQNGFNKMMAVK